LKRRGKPEGMPHEPGRADFILFFLNELAIFLRNLAEIKRE
jgi:hypothetical protein